MPGAGHGRCRSRRRRTSAHEPPAPSATATISPGLKPQHGRPGGGRPRRQVRASRGRPRRRARRRPGAPALGGDAGHAQPKAERRRENRPGSGGWTVFATQLGELAQRARPLPSRASTGVSTKTLHEQVAAAGRRAAGARRGRAILRTSPVWTPAGTVEWVGPVERVDLDLGAERRLHDTRDAALSRGRCRSARSGCRARRGGARRGLPAAPPRRAAAPAPVMRSVAPSSTPAGTLTVSVRSSSRRPSPRQSGQGEVTISPMPLQRPHGRGRHHLAEDRLAHALDLARAPAVRAAWSGDVPVRAPLPAQVMQATGAFRLTSWRAPKTASCETDLSTISASAPCRRSGALAAVGLEALAKKTSKRSPRPPLKPNGRPAAGAGTGTSHALRPEHVVAAAALGVAQRLVGER